ncbi:TraR/DksA C4-type zinc finger protein [Aeromonas caviae]|uniref:TraR/DksA C4-type zinc finger protein n=1 Tax=Aeromonas caviae TaxID=648 RepID=UPI0029DAD37C|nr:TraR/DksA C4-type zinc finger protein [Aeromonas caviae]MDX7596219.1 TraR/DksA C4-type zinc finger protein [Aeromonas caviae]MEA9415950.1 TraR/DksA C4-type zinc finger protein [Aeromonas caviae]
MSRLDDELERLADISEQQIAARVHAARISGTGPHYCIDCDEPIPQARREAIRGCERCTDCQTLAEHHNNR